MKSTPIILLLLVLMSACSTMMYQLQEFERVEPSSGQSTETLDYSGIHLHVLYDFWEKDRSFSCRIENKSDSLVMIDLSLSHFIYKGLAFAYYNNKTSLKSVSLSDNRFFSVATTINSAVIQQEEKFLVIPPHSSKYLQTFEFLDTFKHCDLKLHEDSTCLIFNAQNSPRKFSNRFYYTVENNPRLQTVNNEFYLSKVENLSHSKLWDTKPLYYRCSNTPTGYYIDYSPKQAKNRCYYRLQ